MAAPAVDIKIKGVKQLDAGARRLFANIEDAVDADAVVATAQQVAATVRARVPHRSGRLAASVNVQKQGRVARVAMGAGLPYAGWIEFGGSRGRRRVRRGRYEYPTAKRTERAFRKHAETACAAQIGGMHWPTPR